MERRGQVEECLKRDIINVKKVNITNSKKHLIIKKKYKIYEKYCKAKIASNE